MPNHALTRVNRPAQAFGCAGALSRYLCHIVLFDNQQGRLAPHSASQGLFVEDAVLNVHEASARLLA